MVSGGSTDSVHVFREALAGLERIEASILSAMQRRDEAWQKGYIELRRQLQAQLTALATTARRCPQIEGNAELAARFRDALSKLRSALALHQARWPVVAIDPADPDYKQSIGTVRAASETFAKLAHAIVAGAVPGVASSRIPQRAQLR